MKTISTTETMTTTTTKTQSVPMPNQLAAAYGIIRRRPDTTRLLNDPSVLKAIRAVLRRHHTPFQDFADGVAEVQTRALEATHDQARPADVAGWRALCITIADRMCMKEHLRAGRWAKYETGLTEKPDEHPPIGRSPGRLYDPVDQARYLAILKGQFDAGHMPADGDLILFRTADGFSAEEIAGELRVPKTTVQERLKRMRALFARKLASLGMLVLMMMLMVLFAVPFGGGVGHPRPEPTAAALRDEALQACDAEEWDDCLEKLDEAKALDPEGDQAPEFEAARVRANEARPRR